MATKRTPRNPGQRRISGAALDLFVAWRALEAGEAARETLAALRHELGLRPWQYPGIEDPDVENPHPVGCHTARVWEQRRQDGIALYLALEAAVEARRAKDSAP